MTGTDSFHCTSLVKTIQMTPILVTNISEQEDRIRKEFRKTVMEFSNHCQNEISIKASHMHRHIL